MFAKTIKNLAFIIATPVLILGFATPASAQSSSSEEANGSSAYAQLFSQYTQQQGLFSEHALALFGAHFSSDLSEEQRNALWFGPTDAQQAYDCREKYGLHSDEPQPAIAVRKDCSTEVIETTLYEDALKIAVAAPSDKLFNSSSTN